SEIPMKKNILHLLMSLLFLIAADAHAQEWCDEDLGFVESTDFYAKFLTGVNFLQNTSIDGNKSTYSAGYIIAGSLGYHYCYGLSFEAEYAFRRNSIGKIHFISEGSSSRG